MAVWTVFYDPTSKEIVGQIGGTDIDSAQQAYMDAQGCKSLEVTQDDTPTNHWYVNDAENGITAKGNMGITMSAESCSIDETITFSNVTQNCKIELDKQHSYTMNDATGSLTVTGKQAGSYYITFTHAEPQKYFWQGFTFVVNRSIL